MPHYLLQWNFHFCRTWARVFHRAYTSSWCLERFPVRKSTRKHTHTPFNDCCPIIYVWESNCIEIVCSVLLSFFSFESESGFINGKSIKSFEVCVCVCVHTSVLLQLKCMRVNLHSICVWGFFSTHSHSILIYILNLLHNVNKKKQIKCRRM